MNIGDIHYQSGSIVSVVLLKNPAGSVTAFAFAGGQELSEHTTPHDALVSIWEGEMEISIGGTPTTLTAGSSLVLPANVPHALVARKPSKMMLTMLKNISA